jgi:hypothetical protein
VIDRFFETKSDALAWSQTHPPFIAVRIVAPGVEQKPKSEIADVDANGNQLPPSRKNFAPRST